MDPRLFGAVRTNNTTRIQELVDEDCSILFGATPEGNTALHLAVRFQWQPSARKICELCPLDLLTYCNVNGQTPIHLATLGHNISTIIMLTSKAGMNHGEIIRMADSNGDNAFHLALRENHEGVASKLLDLDGKELSDLINKKGESPLYLAASKRLPRLVKRLLEFNPSNYRGPPGNQTALHAAVAQLDIGKLYTFICCTLGISHDIHF